MKGKFGRKFLSALTFPIAKVILDKKFNHFNLVKPCNYNLMDGQPGITTSKAATFEPNFSPQYVEKKDPLWE